MFRRSSSMNCGYGRTALQFWRCKVESPFLKIPIFAFPTCRMARKASVSRPKTPKATCSRRSGRSRTRAFDAARYFLNRQVPLRASLETSHFGFGLSSPQLVERTCRLFGRSELPAEVSAHLRHAQDGFGRDVAVIGQ